MKDVRVPEQLMRAMAAEAEAAREARAKVIAAEGEHKASRALRQAAEVIVDSPAALQVHIFYCFFPQGTRKSWPPGRSKVSTRWECEHFLHVLKCF